MGETKDAPSLEVLRIRLDGDLNNLIKGKVPLSMAQGLELNVLEGPFQAKPFCDSVKSHFPLLINLMDLQLHFPACSPACSGAAFSEGTESPQGSSFPTLHAPVPRMGGAFPHSQSPT